VVASTSEEVVVVVVVVEEGWEEDLSTTRGICFASPWEWDRWEGCSPRVLMVEEGVWGVLASSPLKISATTDVLAVVGAEEGAGGVGVEGIGWVEDLGKEGTKVECNSCVSCRTSVVWTLCTSHNQ
jgi:hypothetical protein